MTKEQEDFLHLVIVEQRSYAEVEQILKMERSEISKWWEELKAVGKVFKLVR